MNETGSPSKTIGSGPKTRVCYVCGRQYGLHSYEIHLKQCKELWIAREAQKDPKERKPLPEDPMLRMSRGGGGGGATEGSGRSPSPSRGAPRSSGGGDSASGAGGGGDGELSLDEINRMASDAFNNVALSKCEFCGRTFLPEKLAIHNRSCTADNPARRIDESVRRGLETPKVSATRPTTRQDRRDVRDSRESLASRDGRPREADDSGVDSSLDDGRQAAPMQGAAGRGLRKAIAAAANAPNKSPPRPRTGGASFGSKEEAITFLSGRIEAMEATVDDLQRSLVDMRAALSMLAAPP